MDASSSQGPFMLAALIVVILNSIFAEPEEKVTAQSINHQQSDAHVVLMESEQKIQLSDVVLE